MHAHKKNTSSNLYFYDDPYSSVYCFLNEIFFFLICIFNICILILFFQIEIHPVSGKDAKQQQKNKIKFIFLRFLVGISLVVYLRVPVCSKKSQSLFCSQIRLKF